MSKKRFKYYTVIILFAVLTIYPQSTSNSKFQEMKNSFILGLNEKGLEIASELLSRPEYSDVREETVFYIAELFFVLGSGVDDLTNLNKAYTYYIVYNNDYPNSIYTDKVTKKIKTLESFYGGLILFRNLDEIIASEAPVVDKKLSFATKTLFWFANPNIYKFFVYTESEQSSIELLDRYFDEIIINHPDFEIYAYYYKIIARLSKISNLDFVKEGEIEFDVKKIVIGKTQKLVPELFSPEANVFHLELENMLKPLSEKYPNHPLVLNLHLIYANLFMRKIDDKFDADTKQHLEFVVKNELDKTHPRYLMAKEFLLSNKF